MASVANWEAEYNRPNTSNAVSGPSIPRRAESALLERDDEPMPDVANLPEEPLPDETPLEQLTRHWMNERHAPDILPAQDVLLSSLLDHIRLQVRIPSSWITPLIHVLY
jgi:GINS complex subunit 4